MAALIAAAAAFVATARAENPIALPTPDSTTTEDQDAQRREAEKRDDLSWRVLAFKIEVRKLRHRLMLSGKDVDRAAASVLDRVLAEVRERNIEHNLDMIALRLHDDPDLFKKLQLGADLQYAFKDLRFGARNIKEFVERNLPGDLPSTPGANGKSDLTRMLAEIEAGLKAQEDHAAAVRDELETGVFFDAPPPRKK